MPTVAYDFTSAIQGGLFLLVSIFFLLSQAQDASTKSRDVCGCIDHTFPLHIWLQTFILLLPDIFAECSFIFFVLVPKQGFMGSVPSFKFSSSNANVCLLVVYYCFVDKGLCEAIALHGAVCFHSAITINAWGSCRCWHIFIPPADLSRTCLLWAAIFWATLGIVL